MHLLNRIFKPRKKLVIAGKDHDALKRKYLPKLNNASRKNGAAFINAIKEFFSERFNIKYDFTFSELMALLKKKKIRKDIRARLENHLKNIESAYYSSENIDKITLKQFNAELKNIISEL